MKLAHRSVLKQMQILAYFDHSPLLANSGLSLGLWFKKFQIFIVFNIKQRKMTDTAISLKFHPDFSVDFPWCHLRISEDSLKIWNWFISHESAKNPYKFCRESPGYPQGINIKNPPQFPRGFSFYLQPKFPRGFPSTMYPPSPGIPCRIRVILPAVYRRYWNGY